MKDVRREEPVASRNHVDRVSMAQRIGMSRLHIYNKRKSSKEEITRKGTGLTSKRAVALFVFSRRVSFCEW